MRLIQKGSAGNLIVGPILPVFLSAGTQDFLHRGFLGFSGCLFFKDASQQAPRIEF